jgi:hypothetical protein
LDLVFKVGLNDLNLSATLALNFSGIAQAHFSEVYLAWLQSFDSYYDDDGAGGVAAGFTSGKYRVIRINCPVDVNVYNDENELVASIVADVPQEISSIVTAINEEDEKLVFLPASGAYRIELTATGDGEMTYSLNEYNPRAGEVNKLVNYYDVPIVTGQELVGEIPSYSAADLEDATAAASSTAYTLATNGSIIEPSEELSGTSATSAYFYVDVTIDDASKGVAFGAGSRQRGTFAKVTVEPYEGNNFVGWYENGTTFISDEMQYRFRVMKDVNLVAKFTEPEPELGTGNESGGGCDAGLGILAILAAFALASGLKRR